MIVERVVNSFLNSLEVVLTANEYLNDTSSSSKLVVVNFDKHLTLKLRDVSYPKQRNEEFNANPQIVIEKNVLKTLQLNLCNFLESHKKNTQVGGNVPLILHYPFKTCIVTETNI